MRIRRYLPNFSKQISNSKNRSIGISQTSAQKDIKKQPIHPLRTRSLWQYHHQKSPPRKHCYTYLQRWVSTHPPTQSTPPKLPPICCPIPKICTIQGNDHSYKPLIMIASRPFPDPTLYQNHLYPHSKIFKTVIPPRTQFLSPGLPLLLLFRVIVEIPCIGRIFDDRYYRTSVLPAIYIIPYDALEERVFFNACCAPGCVAETEGSVDGAELADKVLGGGRGVGLGGKLNRFAYDSVAKG